MGYVSKMLPYHQPSAILVADLSKRSMTAFTFVYLGVDGVLILPSEFLRLLCAINRCTSLLAAVKSHERSQVRCDGEIT